MRTVIAVAALLGIAFASASISSAFAQSSMPGTPSKPNKVTSVPPPPPGPGKFVTPTKPSKTGPAVIVIFPSPGAKPSPKPIDDIAGTDGTKEGPVVSGSYFGPVRPPSPPPTPGAKQLVQ